MKKCRICFKNSNKLRSIYDGDQEVKFIDMLSSLCTRKILKDDNLPNQICLSCRNKLRAAYKFKLEIENSETILLESFNCKNIRFNNIDDIRIRTNINYKPTVPAFNNVIEHFLQKEITNVTYKQTTITKIENHIDNKPKTLLTVKEFLDSVNIKSEDDYNNDIDEYLDADFDDPYDSDYNHKKQLESRKKVAKTKNPKYNIQNIKQPIKPVFLKDLKIAPTQYTRAKRKECVSKKDKHSVCPFCGKMFREKYLNTHMLNHDSERPYKCDQCSKTFTTANFLRYHKKKHELTPEFKCHECIAAFTTKLSLQSHMLVHSEVKNHICDVCHKGFKRKYALSRHILIHNFGKKSIQCELCPMSFHSKVFLRHHMRVHTGERPYKCEICSQPYSYKHDFNRHCLKKHGVFLKRRSINTMNEEVLQQERALMRDLTLRAHGVINSNELPSVFEGPQGALAFQMAMKAVEAQQIPITIDTTYKI